MSPIVSSYFKSPRDGLRQFDISSNLLTTIARLSNLLLTNLCRSRIGDEDEKRLCASAAGSHRVQAL